MIERIAIVTNSLSLGGAERISILLANWLKSKDVEVALITLNKDKEKKYELDPSIHRIALNQDSNSSIVSTTKCLRKSIKKYNPSTILVMGVPLSIYVIPATIALKIPLIISERNDPSNFSGKKITRILSRLFMFYAKGYVFQTHGAMKYYPKIIQRKSAVIPNPIMVESMPEPYEGERTKRIVSVARLVPQKNQELLIKSFKKIADNYPDYTLIIYGDGSERNKLIKLVEQLNLKSRVRLPGAVNDIFNEILDAEIFVLSSDFEGMPNALIEAMALGIPCISTDCPSGGPATLITQMDNGILVPVGNVKEMENAIENLIIDRELAANLGKKAKEVINCLDKDKICKDWLDYFNKVKEIN